MKINYKELSSAMKIICRTLAILVLGSLCFLVAAQSLYRDVSNDDTRFRYFVEKDSNETVENYVLLAEQTTLNENSVHTAFISHIGTEFYITHTLYKFMGVTGNAVVFKSVKFQQVLAPDGSADVDSFAAQIFADTPTASRNRAERLYFLAISGEQKAVNAEESEIFLPIALVNPQEIRFTPPELWGKLNIVLTYDRFYNLLNVTLEDF